MRLSHVMSVTRIVSSKLGEQHRHNSCTKPYDQGSKLAFLCGCQVATEIFFSRQMENSGR